MPHVIGTVSGSSQLDLLGKRHEPYVLIAHSDLTVEVVKLVECAKPEDAERAAALKEETVPIDQ